jgi:hypothetical protein
MNLRSHSLDKLRQIVTTGALSSSESHPWLEWWMVVWQQRSTGGRRQATASMGWNPGGVRRGVRPG